MLAEVMARDSRDMGRATSPLRRATDAEVIDTSDLSIDAAVARAVNLVADRLATTRSA